MAASIFHQFQTELWNYYEAHGRHELPWRIPEPDGSFDPYKILVSELMLQQTQVPRVIQKYHEFLARFPTVQALANASLGEVLLTWSGLGYNRRAKYLWQAAQMISDQFSGNFPRTRQDLVQLPGVGSNTAGAILAYAYNQPALFVETNIRSVYIHHFLSDRAAVADSELLPLITQTLDTENPRVFYWALMDYGGHLKRSVGNTARASKSYAKQSPFHGSKRQLRGQVLRELAQGAVLKEVLLAKLADERAKAVVAELEAEGMIRRGREGYQLA